MLRLDQIPLALHGATAAMKHADRLNAEQVQALRDHLLQDSYYAAMDDSHHFIQDALEDGYQFKGYKNLTVEELVEELWDGYIDTLDDEDSTVDLRVEPWVRTVVGL